VAATALYVFRQYALLQLGVCVAGCLAAEALFTAMRRRPLSLGDFSAVVTGAILAFSLPATAPWYVGVVGAFVAVGIGKAVFGGLGQNIFNPAMVGRAFVMICFPAALGGAAGYVRQGTGLDVISQATPLTAAREALTKGAEADLDLRAMALGTENGSVGETGALACLLGGLYLCLRRTASWEIPLGVLLGAAGLGAVVRWGGLTNLNVAHQLAGGAVMFGAFFIATDPVTSPLAPKGKFVFGLCVGLLVVVMRTFGSYPEGVMFSVLIMNSFVPLINRWIVPRPLGGPVPAPRKS